MYPGELSYFIEGRKRKLGGEDLLRAVSIQENPQLNHIEYDVGENKYRMWDKYGNYYEFEAIPYEEVQKVKKITRKEGKF